MVGTDEIIGCRAGSLVKSPVRNQISGWAYVAFGQPLFGEDSYILKIDLDVTI